MYSINWFAHAFSKRVEEEIRVFFSKLNMHALFHIHKLIMNNYKIFTIS